MKSASPNQQQAPPTTGRIFVFGSNLAGIHGAGSAKAAATKHGAERGVGAGRTGSAYAIPTKETWRSPALPLTTIALHVVQFVRYALANPDLTFDVVRIGCGLAGYEDRQIAPLFYAAPDNVNLPFGWRELIAYHCDRDDEHGDTQAERDALPFTGGAA